MSYKNEREGAMGVSIHEPYILTVEKIEPDKAALIIREIDPLPKTEVIIPLTRENAMSIAEAILKKCI